MFSSFRVRPLIREAEGYSFAVAGIGIEAAAAEEVVETEGATEGAVVAATGAVVGEGEGAATEVAAAAVATDPTTPICLTPFQTTSGLP